MPASVRLDANLEKRLDLLAKKTGRTRASCLREVVSRGIAEVEDYYLAADVLERVRQGQEKTRSANEVRSLLGLND